MRFNGTLVVPRGSELMREPLRTQLWDDVLRTVYDGQSGPLSQDATMEFLSIELAFIPRGYLRNENGSYLIFPDVDASWCGDSARRNFSNYVRTGKSRFPVRLRMLWVFVRIHPLLSDHIDI